MKTFYSQKLIKSFLKVTVLHILLLIVSRGGSSGPYLILSASPAYPMLPPGEREEVWRHPFTKFLEAVKIHNNHTIERIFVLV